MNLDSQKLDRLLNLAVADLSAGYGGVMISLGYKLGLYRAMAGAGPLSSAEVARRSECAERYVREWLNAQVAGGYVAYHPSSETYELTPEQAMVLADDTSPVFIPTAWQVRRPPCGPTSTRRLRPSARGKGVSWGEHDERLYCGVAAFYRNAYQGSLVQEWLPALEGVMRKLERGARVADVGCGHGHSTVIMAKAFPASPLLGLRRARGLDHGSAAQVAERAGVADRVSFASAKASAYPVAELRSDLLLRLPARHGPPRARRRATRPQRSHRTAPSCWSSPTRKTVSRTT